MAFITIDVEFIDDADADASRHCRAIVFIDTRCRRRRRLADEGHLRRRCQPPIFSLRH